MAARKVKCAACGTSFAPQRSTAKYCKPACREQARRDRSAAAKPAKKTTRRPAKKAAAKKATSRPPTEAAPPADEAPAAGLVDTVRRDLEAANALNSFNGQLALELARRVANPDEASTSALSKELRAVMALAVGAAAPAAGEQPPVAPPEDEVEKARRKREEARQAAGLS